MKLKGCLKGLCTLGLTTLLISFVSATFTAHPIGVFTPSVGDSSISLSVMQLGEVYSEQGTIEKFVFAPTNDLLFYWDIDSKPTLLLPNCYSNRYGGELKYYYTCDVISDSNFNGMTNCQPFQEINDNYLSEFLGTIRESDSWAYDYHLGQRGFNLCFSSQSEGKSVCFGTESSVANDWCYMWQSDLTCQYGYCSYTSPFSGGEYTSLTYTLDSIPLEEIGFSPSAPSTPSTPTPNVNVGICPTVKTLLSTSNLTPAVCYAGYDSDLIYEAGENTPIEFGSGITIFETYDLFSGNMTIQNWYDTYWNYYQNISWNGYPFYGKPKALLGIETARQIAGTSAGYKGSYVILNYCWYLLGNFDENASTCILPKLDSVYSGIIITNQDKQDLIDDLNDDYDIRRPGSGSIYDGVWSGNGGGVHSRGDECNSIPCMFNKFYDMFNTTVVDDVDFTSAGGGILPSYIGLAFVVIVLFYIFKR